MPHADSPSLPGPCGPVSLALWMVASVAVFVLVGSLALVWAFERHFVREERRAFEQLAATNARFIERTRLPQSAQTASQLGEILGVRVYFRESAGGGWIGKRGESMDAPHEWPPDGRARDLPGGDRLVALPARGGAQVLFVLPAAQRMPALKRRDTWLVLGGFWLLSLALGAWLAGRVTRPLASLAESLPLVGEERELPPLPVRRRDEIGRLAQTLERTHRSLREERERRRAAERHALLGRMAAGFAHEIRNPLAAIRLHAQLLEGAGEDETAVSRRLIEGEAGRIGDMLDQWLLHARPAPPQLAAVDLASLVRQAVDLLGPQARHAGVVIDLGNIDPDASWRIMADGPRVRQVVGNILRNALQVTPAGGTVRVRLEHAGGFSTVVIEDQGSGFSKSALARLGEPFYSEKEGGMGLGLAVSMDICRAHGGSLTVRNLAGRGACVRADFPNLKPTPSSAP